jgi:PAS domain S-box-containing protein
VAIADAQVLVVDDDARHAASVRELLTAHGYRAACECAGDGEFDRLVDVLIVDLNLPKPNSADVLRALQARNPAVKTIVVGGAPNGAAIAELIRLGICDYLAKPYEPELLLQSVHRAFARTRAEQEQRAQPLQHEAFMRALPDLAYSLDAQGRFSFIGDRLSDVFGYDRDSLLGRPWADLLGPALVASLRHRFDERRSGERATRQLDFEWRDPSGGLHVIELSATGMYNGERPKPAEFCGTSGLLRDVTVVRHELADLTASETRYRELFARAPIAAFVSRLADGRQIESNDAFRTLFAGNTNDSDAIVFGDAAARGTFVNALPRHTSEIVIEQRGSRANRRLALHTRRFTVDGTEYLHATISDVTQQQQEMEQRVARLTQQHRTQLRDTVHRLAAAIAHDFNELLARIIGYAERIRDAMTGVEYQRSGRLLDELFATTHRTRDFISQLLLSVETVAEPQVSVSPDTGEVVIIDAEACIGDLLRDSLQQAGLAARVFGDSESALEYITADPGVIALVLLDEPQTDARIARVALRIHALRDAPPVVTMRGSAASSLGPGAPEAAIAGTIAKPFSTQTLLDVVQSHMRVCSRAAPVVSV